jgi:hydrogenase maturation factor
VSGGADACGIGDPHCITCGDEGIPMTVLEARGDTAVCIDAEHGRHDVAVELIGMVNAGDGLLVHAGVAIAQLEEARG